MIRPLRIEIMNTKLWEVHKLECPYCGEDVEILSSKEFYGIDYGTYVYLCRPCDAYVGTHKHSKKPLGTLAKKELRELRMKCHALIDPFWKSGKMRRSEVYSRISKEFGLPKSKTHIGMFNEEQCRKLISYFK